MDSYGGLSVDGILRDGDPMNGFYGDNYAKYIISYEGLESHSSKPRDSRLHNTYSIQKMY
jgi:hypothetical protein